MEVSALTHISKGDYDQLVELMRFFSDKKVISFESLHNLLKYQIAKLVIARRDGMIVGCLMLSTVRTLVSERDWIDDVIVHPEFRGNGIGDKLITHALNITTASSVNLTCSPSRKAANKIYERYFEKRDSNLYRNSKNC